MGLEHRQGEIRGPLGWFVERPAVTKYASVVMAVAFALMWIWAFSEYLKFPDAPSPMTIAEASDLRLGNTGLLWVEITDGEWQCDNSLRTNDRATFLVQDRSTGQIVLADFNDPVFCDYAREQGLSGTLEVASVERLERLRDQGIDLSSQPASTPTLAVCTYCTKTDRLLGVIVCAALTLLSIALVPIVRSVRRQYGYE